VLRMPELDQEKIDKLSASVREAEERNLAFALPLSPACVVTLFIMAKAFKNVPADKFDPVRQFCSFLTDFCLMCMRFWGVEKDVIEALEAWEPGPGEGSSEAD